MKVLVKFKASSPLSTNGVESTEVFEDVIEVHYGYSGTERVAIVVEDNEYTYAIKDIEELEAQ